MEDDKVEKELKEDEYNTKIAEPRKISAMETAGGKKKNDGEIEEVAVSPAKKKQKE